MGSPAIPPSQALSCPFYFAPMMPPGAPQAVPPPPQPSGPAGSPMAQPSPNEGSAQVARVQIETAMQMLEMAMPQIGSQSEEGRAVLRALSALSQKFNRQKSQDMVPAQIAQMAQSQKQSPIGQILGGGQAPAGAAPQPQPMAGA